jgi:hypothetical protein
MTNDDCVFRCPPERLRRVLEELIVDASFHALNTGRAFARVMNGQPDDERRYWYFGMTAFVELSHAAEAYVEQRVRDYAISPYQKTFGGIQRIIGQMNVEQTWNSYFEQFRPYVETALPLIVHTMEAASPVLSVPRSSLEEVVTGIEAVRETVKNSTLPPLLKHQLEIALGELVLKIARYELYGLDGIASAAAGVVATIIVQSEGAKSSPSTVKAVLDVIGKVQDILLKAAGLWAIAGPTIVGLLEAANK